MPSINIPFPDPINISCQVGDIVYAIGVAAAGGSIAPNAFQVANLSTALEIGFIWQITNQEGLIAGVPISIDVWQTGAGPCNAGGTPCFNSGDFIMFSKDKAVNTSGIKGYYAEATFKNASLGDVELFSIGVGIAASSS